jgi:integrase/recombinase XerD
VRERLVASNPTLTVLVPKVGQRLPDYLSVPEQERLLDVLSPDTSLKGRRLHMIVLLGLFTGLRVSELVAIRLDEIDLERAVLRVTKGKGNKQRESVLTPRLMTALRAYLADVRPAYLPLDDTGQPVQVPWLFLSDQAWKGRATKDRMVEPLTTKAVACG